jgi:hypothetical protein
MRTVDPDTAIKEIGRNPVEVKRKWRLHELENDPEIRKLLRDKTFKKLETMEQEAMQDAGSPPQPQAAPLPFGQDMTMAPGPNGAAPMMPMAQPTPQDAALAMVGPGNQPPGPVSGTPEIRRER